jgi:hypothetical protein
MRTPTLGLDAEFEELRQRATRQLAAFTPLPTPAFQLPPKPLTNGFDYRHDFTAEIEAGVALLDATLGREAWIRDVNLGVLDLGNADLCLVAQLTYSSYEEGVVRFGGPDATYDDVDEWEPYVWGTRYGFAVPDELCDQYGGFRLYAQLTDQWVAKIGQLRAAVTA